MVMMRIMAASPAASASTVWLPVDADFATSLFVILPPLPPPLIAIIGARECCCCSSSSQCRPFAECSIEHHNPRNTRRQATDARLLLSPPPPLSAIAPSTSVTSCKQEDTPDAVTLCSLVLSESIARQYRTQLSSATTKLLVVLPQKAPFSWIRQTNPAKDFSIVAAPALNSTLLGSRFSTSVWLICSWLH